MDNPILTLEPLLQAVREGIQSVGWELSGLQKTTSHEFEGRWEGESTRSAYLFFHPEDGPDHVSVDVYLDETSRGLTGNLALVVDLVALAGLGSPERALRELGALGARCLPRGASSPLTLRLRMKDAAAPPPDAEVEVRFKTVLAKRVIAGGAEAVRTFAVESVLGFERIMKGPELAKFVDSP